MGELGRSSWSHLGGQDGKSGLADGRRRGQGQKKWAWTGSVDRQYSGPGRTEPHRAANRAEPESRQRSKSTYLVSHVIRSSLFDNPKAMMSMHGAPIARTDAQH